MKTLLLSVLCLNVSAFEYLDGQKLPTAITYSCEDPALESSFKRMFAIWNFACDGIFTLSKVDSGATIAVQVDPSLSLPVVGDTVTLGNAAIIQIQTNDPLRDQTMLHEIGHALGLAHSLDPNAIMQAQIKLEATLGQDDVDGVRELYGLSPKIFDFTFSLRGTTVILRSDYAANWLGSDGWHANKRKRTRHRFPVGTCQIEMIANGISVFKTLTLSRN